jgi:hypothetical protein
MKWLTILTLALSLFLLGCGEQSQTRGQPTNPPSGGATTNK